MNLVKTANQVTSEVQGGWYLRTKADDEDWESGMNVDDMDEAQLAAAADLLKVSPEFLEAVNDELKNIRESVHNELAFLYMR